MQRDKNLHTQNVKYKLIRRCRQGESERCTWEESGCICAETCHASAESAKSGCRSYLSNLSITSSSLDRFGV